MVQNHGIFQESNQVIQEIEGQLETLLQRKIDDIEKDLEDRIRREKEAAHRRKEELEREFVRGRGSLEEYRTMVRETEEERNGLLDRARTHFNKVIGLQSEIEGLAKATVEEIQRVNEIQQRIEALRERTAERAAFLKKDLREKYGISAEIFEGGPKPLDLDLDDELNKLKKIKDLLAVESAAAGLGVTAAEPSAQEKPAAVTAEPRPDDIRIPEIQELIAASHPVEDMELTADEPLPAPVEEGPEPAPSDEESEAVVRESLESYRRSEPANGSGEILYFEKEGKVVLDGESIFAAVEKTLDEAQRLSAKLGMTESPKGQFFIKQELINWQEGLRGLFLRIIKMTEKNAWTLPSFTSDILNAPALRSLLERLSMENWSNPDEFTSFSETMAEMKNAFQARTEPRFPYLRALKRDVESR